MVRLPRSGSKYKLQVVILCPRQQCKKLKLTCGTKHRSQTKAMQTTKTIEKEDKLKEMTTVKRIKKRIEEAVFE